MVAVVLLTVVVFGVVALQTGHLGVADTQNSQTQAYFLAQEGLEVLEGLGKDEINEAFSGGCEEGVCLCRLTQEGEDYGFDCGTDTEELDDFVRYFDVDGTTLQNEALQIESVVEWIDQTGSHQVSAKRVIYE